MTPFMIHATREAQNANNSMVQHYVTAGLGLNLSRMDWTIVMVCLP